MTLLIPTCNVSVVCLSGGQDSSAEVEHRSHAAAVLQVTGVGGLSHSHTHTHTHTHTENFDFHDLTQVMQIVLTLESVITLAPS